MGAAFWSDESAGGSAQRVVFTTNVLGQISAITLMCVVLFMKSMHIGFSVSAVLCLLFTCLLF